MTMNPLVGTWRLLSFEVRDERGEITYPFGRDVLGFITYTADGHMSVQFGRKDRPHLGADDWWGATPAEISAAARDYFAYCGTYVYQDGEVVHRIGLSLMPNWIDGTQLRLVQLDRDTATLSTHPMPVCGQLQVATLVWQRV
ncbi:MAG TPA: lipocalin-like domain-containing protein [Thermomicrobiales bacterium]|nr:lipocalin-like domain-containing protein [Thermomicrobiales bacterium]